MNFSEFKSELFTANVGIRESKISEVDKVRWLACWSLGLAELQEFTSVDEGQWQHALEEAGDFLWYCAALHRFFEEVLGCSWGEFDVDKQVAWNFYNGKHADFAELVAWVFQYQGRVKKLIRDKRWEDKKLIAEVQLCLHNVSIFAITYVGGLIDVDGAYQAVLAKLTARYGAEGFSIESSINRKV